MSSAEEATPSKPSSLEVSSTLTSATAIKKIATLNDADFKSFHEQATAYVEGGDDRCATLPRALTNAKWAELINELVDDLGLGGEFWNAERKDFIPEIDLVYPKDTELIRLIVFSMLKCEVIRQAKAKKRGTEEDQQIKVKKRGNEGEESIKPPPAKKNRVSQTPKDKEAGKAPAKKEKFKSPTTAPKTPASKEKTKAPSVTKVTSTATPAEPMVEATTATASKPAVPKQSIEVEYTRESASPVPIAPGSTLLAAGDDNIEPVHHPAPPTVTGSAPIPTPATTQEAGTSGALGTHNDIFTPALTRLRAVTEPPSSARDLLQMASSAINAASRPLGAPLFPWKSVKFRVQVMASDPEVTIALMQERQVHTLKPIDLQWETFLGTVMHGLQTYKHAIAFVLAKQVRVRTPSGIYCLPKEGGGVVWKEVMNDLVESNDEAGVDVIFFP